MEIAIWAGHWLEEAQTGFCPFKPLVLGPHWRLLSSTRTMFESQRAHKDSGQYKNLPVGMFLRSMPHFDHFFVFFQILQA
jgi:hypothetical protein